MGRQLIRGGKCTHCGECCIGCQFLKTLPSGRSSCRVYPDRAKPEYNPYLGPGGPTAFNSCTYFPSHPNQIRDCPSCTYEFYDAQTGERIVATDQDSKGEYDSIQEPILNEHPEAVDVPAAPGPEVLRP